MVQPTSGLGSNRRPDVMSRLNLLLVLSSSRGSPPLPSPLTKKLTLKFQFDLETMDNLWDLLLTILVYYFKYSFSLVIVIL